VAVQEPFASALRGTAALTELSLADCHLTVRARVLSGCEWY
jgi:hypothetical protein